MTSPATADKPCSSHAQVTSLILGFRAWVTHKSGRSGSSTFSTLSTAMGDSRLEYWDTTLLLRDLQGRQQGLSGG